MNELKPDYFAVRGGTGLASSLDAALLEDMKVQIRKAEVVASRAEAGAVIAQALFAYPEIDGFQIIVSGDYEYDDQGGNYWSPTLSLSELYDEDAERPDVQGFLTGIEDHLNSGYQSSLYTAASGETSGAGDFVITVCRKKLASVLAEDRVSGLAVWGLLEVEST
jgi:hypothetical protein